MLIQALTEYTDNYLAEELNDAAWESKPVPWMLGISTQGTFLNVIPRMTSVTRGKKQVQIPIEMRVPRSPVNRNSGHHPLLGTDDIAYVLGAGPWTPEKPADKEKAYKHHEAFVALMGRAAAKTGDLSLKACVRFYASPAEVEKAHAAMQEAKAGALVALSVGGPLADCEAVQTFWRQHYQATFADRMEGSNGECMVTGKLGVIAPTHEKIKGVVSLGGQAAGVALMSFDKDAFRSYGWEQNQNSPVSPDRAMAYVLALNHLLKIDKGRRKDIAGIGFLSWLRKPGDMDALDLMERADPAQVQALLNFDPRADPDPNRFYMLGVSGNGGRLRVRYWADQTLTQVKLNLQNWHLQLRLEYPWNDPAPVRLWQLLYALDREGKPSEHSVLSLLRRGIEGVPLGYSMLSAVLTRLRHPGGDIGTNTKEQKSDPMSLQRLRIPMSLVRMCLNDLSHHQKGSKEMSEGLDPTCTIPAYVCGRLMAEYENLQRASNDGEVNSSVLDRYFALASTYPTVAFPKMETLGIKHLRKLRRDKRAWANAIDAQLQSLHALLHPSESGAYPAKLSLEGQGLFMLGYYHHKAASITQARDRKQSNEVANQKNHEEND